MAQRAQSRPPGEKAEDGPTCCSDSAAGEAILTGGARLAQKGYLIRARAWVTRVRHPLTVVGFTTLALLRWRRPAVPYRPKIPCRDSTAASALLSRRFLPMEEA